MNIVSAYLIRQVRTDPNVDDLVDLWDRAKKAGNPNMISNSYYITEGEQKFFGIYNSLGRVIWEYRKRTDSTVTNGCTISNPSEPWNIYRYIVERQMYGGHPRFIVNVWYSPTVAANIEYIAGDTWFKTTDVDQSGAGTCCMKHVVEDNELVYYDDSKLQAWRESFASNIPHFETSEDATEFSSTAQGFWNGTVTKDEFKRFLGSKMVNP